MTLVLQKAVPPAQVTQFLTEGYDRISGYVVRAAEVSGVTSVADLRALHHTSYEGSPFPDDGPLHILHVDRSPSWQLLPATRLTERDVMETSGTVEIDEQLVETFFLDHTRLTSGARLWRFEDGVDPQLRATYLGPAFGWQDHENDNALKAAVPAPTIGSLVVLGDKAFVADVASGDDGVPTAITAVTGTEPPAELGFQQNVLGNWVRAVEHSEATALFEVRVTASWNDHPVLVVHSFRLPDGAQVSRVFSVARNWEQARDAGLHEVELGVWEATVPIAEVQNLHPQEVSAQPWMTAQQRERVARAQQASRQNSVTPAQAGGIPGAGQAGTIRPVPGTVTWDPGTGSGDAAHLALYQRIAQGVLPNLPQGASQAQVLCQTVGNVMELSAQAVLQDGSPVGIPQLSQDVSRAFAELRSIGAASGEGPWFGALVTITSEGKFTINYNKDAQPRMQRIITAEMLRIERERFPRDEWPRWFTDLEDEATE